MKAKFCGQCGSALREGAAFCGQCGWKVTEYEPGSSPQAHPAAEGGRPAKGKGGKAGLVLGIVAGIAALAALVLGIKALSGGASGIGPYDLNGPWSVTSTMEKITVNGKSDPAYASAEGQKTEMQMILSLDEDGKGVASFSGMVYGFGAGGELAAEYKNGKIRLYLEENPDGTDSEFTGSVKKDGEDLVIEGGFSSSADYGSDKMKTRGTWRAEMAGGAGPSGSASAAGGSGQPAAKADAALTDITGNWTGTMVWQEIRNLDQVPDDMMPEEVRNLYQSAVGKEMDCSMEIEPDGTWEFVMTDPSGQSGMDIDDRDFDPERTGTGVLNLSNGTFSFTQVQDFKEGEGGGKLVFSGRVYEEGGALKIAGDIDMSVSITADNLVDMSVTFTLDNRTPAS